MNKIDKTMRTIFPTAKESERETWNREQGLWILSMLSERLKKKSVDEIVDHIRYLWKYLGRRERSIILQTIQLIEEEETDGMRELQK